MFNSTPVVINWHLTEACNYRCRFCYATWTESTCPSEIIHDPTRTTALLSELSRFFCQDNSFSPLSPRPNSASVRLNLAGGEPLLHAEKLMHITSQARDLGLEVSLISNGSYLTEDLLEQLAPHLSWLGISVDSLGPVTNQALGRIDRHGRFLDVAKLASMLKRGRQNHPDLRLKINTVVNRLNHCEDLAPMIRSFAPDKWKVLRMLPVVTENLTIGNQQFSTFLDRHRAFAQILYAEDNLDMLESYLMIDPYGRFFQNRPDHPGQGYLYSRPIPDAGAETAFSEVNFDMTRYRSRYVSDATRMVV